MHRVLAVFLPLAALACAAPDDTIEPLRPSLTMLRMGEVEVDLPPVIPLDHYLPGIQIKAEDYDALAAMLTAKSEELGRPILLVSDEPYRAITYDDVHALNHQHAEAQAGVDPAATLALLELNAVAAREALGQLTATDLQTSAALALIGGKPISVQQIVQWFLVNHTHNHLAAIHDTLGGT